MENKFGGKIYKVDVFVLAWWGYVLLRTYFLPGVSCCKDILAYSSLLVLYVAVRMLDGKCRVPHHFEVGGLLLVVIWQLLLGVFQLVTGSSHHHLYPVTGSFNNPAPYSALIAMGVVMALDILHKGGHKEKWAYQWLAKMSWLVVCGGCLMLALTFCRSAFLVITLMLAWLYRSYLMRYHALVIVIALVLGITLLYLKWGSAMGRIIIWWQTLSLWISHPWWGVGVNGFAGEYGNQLGVFFSDAQHITLFARYADVTEDAFCDILQLGAEQGMVGAVFCCVIVALSLRGLWQRSQTLCYAWMALLVFSLFSYPLQLLPFQAIAICLMAIGAKGKVLMRIGSWPTAIVCIAFLAMGIGCYFKGNQYRKEHEEARQLQGTTHELYKDDFYRLLPSCSDDRQFLFDFARLLQANGYYRDSNAILRRGVKVSNDPMFWVLMGNNYRQEKMFDAALESYDVAFHRMPNRLYPLYQKMLVLEETHDKAKMRQVARQVMAFLPKIASAATDEMKKEARKRAF